MLLTLTLSYFLMLLEYFSYKKVIQTLRQILFLKIGLQEKSFCAREKGQDENSMYMYTLYWYM
jgi:hypothetical protein